MLTTSDRLAATLRRAREIATGRVSLHAAAVAVLVGCNAAALARLAVLGAEGWVLALGFALPVLIGLWPGRAASILAAGLLVACVPASRQAPVALAGPEPPVLLRVAVTTGRDMGKAATLMIDDTLFRSSESGIVEIPLTSVPASLSLYLIEGMRRLPFDVDLARCGRGPVLHVTLDVVRASATCVSTGRVIGG